MMNHLTDEFLGYNITELVKVCTQVTCPKCKGRMFFIFIAPSGQNLVFLCVHCGYLPSLDDILHKKGE